MKKKKQGFTLSEVIITLVVLGVVAAITVPMMSNSASDKKWNVGCQKAKATIGEAFRLMTVNGEITTKNSDGTDRTTEYMVTKVLPKYLKLEKTCGSGAAAAGACGFKMVSGTPKVKLPDGAQVNLPLSWTASTTAYGVTGTPVAGIYPSRSTNNPTTQNYNNSYFFRTLDGFSVNFFYNPYCSTDIMEKRSKDIGIHVFDTICFMGVFDMNGKKGPNQVGKDIGFVGSFFSGYDIKSDSVLPHNVTKSLNSGATKNFKAADDYCKSLGKDKEWALPGIYQLALIYLNKGLINDMDDIFLSKTLNLYESSGKSVAVIHFKNDSYGSIYNRRDTNNLGNSNTSAVYVRCVRANALK